MAYLEYYKMETNGNVCCGLNESMSGPHPFYIWNGASLIQDQNEVLYKTVNNMFVRSDVLPKSPRVFGSVTAVPGRFTASHYSL